MSNCTVYDMEGNDVLPPYAAPDGYYWVLAIGKTERQWILLPVHGAEFLDSNAQCELGSSQAFGVASDQWTVDARGAE